MKPTTTHPGIRPAPRWDDLESVMYIGWICQVPVCRTPILVLRRLSPLELLVISSLLLRTSLCHPRLDNTSICTPSLALRLKNSRPHRSQSAKPRTPAPADLPPRIRCTVSRSKQSAHACRCPNTTHTRHFLHTAVLSTVLHLEHPSVSSDPVSLLSRRVHTWNTAASS